MNKLRDLRREAIFMLESGIGEVYGKDILEMLFPDMSDLIPYQKEFTKAQAWMASNGNPLERVDAALKVFAMVSPNCDYSITHCGDWTVSDVFGREVWGVSDTLAKALIAATLFLVCGDKT